MDVAAANATLDPRDGRARQKERVAASQTRIMVSHFYMGGDQQSAYPSERGSENAHPPCGRNAEGRRRGKRQTSCGCYSSLKISRSARHRP